MTPEDLNRLQKLMALLDSDLEGERVAALNAANRFLQSKGATWRQLVIMEIVARQGQPRAEDGTAGAEDPLFAEPCDCEDCAREAARKVWDHSEFQSLAEKHQDFIEQIATKWKRPLSDKQRAYVFGLAEKLGVVRRVRDPA